MAGFMAGFGPAFADSFNSARNRAAAERQDTFRLVYQDFIDQRERRSKDEAEDKKAVNKAKALAASVPGLPEEAWMKAYEWVKSDLSDAQIMENLQTGQFQVRTAAASPDTPTAPSSVDTQMEASGIAPATAPQEQRPTAPTELDTGNPITNFLKRKAGRSGDFRREQAIEKIAKQTGADIEEVRATLDGQRTYTEGQGVDPTRVTYTPGAMANEPDKFNTMAEASIEGAQARTAYERNPTPENAARLEKATQRIQAIMSGMEIEAAIKAKAEGKGSNLHKIFDADGNYQLHAQVYTDENGQQYAIQNGKRKDLGPDQQAVPVDEQELKLLDNIDQELLKPSQEMAARKSAVESTIATVDRMNKTVQDSGGRVLADLPSGFVSWLDRFTKGTDVAVELAQDAVNGSNTAAEMFASGEPIDQGMVQDRLSELKGLNDKLMTQNMNDLSVQKGLYETQKAIFTYQLASAMGQEGKSLSEPERKLFAELASVGTDPEKFQTAMAGILNNMVDSVDAQVRAFPENSPSLQRYIQTIGVEPKGYIPTPVSEDLNNSTDPSIKATWGWVRPKPDEPAQSAPTASNEENLPVVNSPAEAAKLPKGTKFKTPDGRIKVVP